MIRCLILGIALWMTLRGVAQTPEKIAPEKVAPEVQKLLQGSPEDFIKAFDKNKNGFLEKDELPPRLAESFEKADTNGDGKLDRQEVAALLVNLRKALAVPEPAGTSEIDRIIDNLLAQFDTNKDGKISKNEAKGRLAENFAILDKNKDGFLDRSELRPTAEKILAQKKDPFAGAFGAAGPGVDFDALDKNADGRLTREEMKGSPLYSRFEEIDTNQDGQIDRREFEAFLRKEAAKKK